MNKILTTFRKNWKIIAIYTALLGAIGLLLGYKLGTLAGALAPAELQLRRQYLGIEPILGNPLHAPYKLLALAIAHIPYETQAMLRLPATILGFATLIPFAYIVKRWYSVRIMVLGLALFATSAWFLHVSRINSLQVEYLWAITTFVALHILLRLYAEKFGVFLLWLVGTAVFLFIPGFIWFVAINIWLQREELLDAWDGADKIWQRIVVVALPLIAFAALGLAFARNPSLALTWIGAPEHFVWIDVLKRLGYSLVYFVARGPADPTVWLGRLPILDAFMTVMFIAGLFFYRKHLQAARTQLLAIFFGLSAILTALNPDIPTSLLVPFVYLVALGGIAYILHEWLKVFPRNPLARGLGIGLVGLVVVASGLFNLRSYFVAWPHNKQTQATFTRTLHED